MNRRRLAIALALVLLPAVAVIAPIAAQDEFPANALIRGENIRVRAELPESDFETALQPRGDNRVLSGPTAVTPEGEFYPVQVPGSGTSGWILVLFIDPASITAGQVTEVVVQPTVAPAAEPNLEVVVEQPPDVVVDVPPTAAPAEEVTPEAEAPRRNRNRENRQRDTEPTPEPEAAAERVIVNGEGAMTSDPVTLVAGEYRVSAAMTVEAATGFTAVLDGPNQFSQTLFDETIEEPQDWSAATDLTIAETGDYTVTVSNANAPWRIRFVPA